MKTLLTLLALAFADGQSVNLATVSGKQLAGELVSVDATHWTLRSNGQDEQLATSEILTASLPNSGMKAEPQSLEVMLTDGSRININQATLEGDWLTIESAALGPQKVARAAIANVRLSPATGPIEQSWMDLTQRDKKQDMLVIRKGEVLDFVEGVVSKVTQADVQVLLDGEPVSVKREKVFGVIYFQRAPLKAKPVGQVELTNGDKLLVRGLLLKEATFKITTAAGAEFTVPQAKITRVDFSTGKLTWLGDLKPRDIKHEFVIMDGLPEYGVDRSLLGERLKVGDKFFDRGVWIHSRTRLRYRLEGDYSRFQAWMGIQSTHTGKVHVEFIVDGQKVFEADAAAGAKAPQRVDLDVKGKFALDIFVDYGEDGDDIGDHLTLGDARLTK